MQLDPMGRILLDNADLMHQCADRLGVVLRHRKVDPVCRGEPDKAHDQKQQKTDPDPAVRRIVDQRIDHGLKLRQREGRHPVAATVFCTPYTVLHTLIFVASAEQAGLADVHGVVALIGDDAVEIALRQVEVPRTAREENRHKALQRAVLIKRLDIHRVRIVAALIIDRAIGFRLRRLPDFIADGVIIVDQIGAEQRFAERRIENVRVLVGDEDLALDAARLLVLPELGLHPLDRSGAPLRDHALRNALVLEILQERTALRVDGGEAVGQLLEVEPGVALVRGQRDRVLADNKQYHTAQDDRKHAPPRRVLQLFLKMRGLLLCSSCHKPSLFLLKLNFWIAFFGIFRENHIIPMLFRQ